TEGNVTVSVTHTGENLSGTAEKQIIRDTIPPIIEITTDTTTGANLLNQNAFMLSGSCSEGVSVLIKVTSSGGGDTVTDEGICVAGLWAQGVDVSNLSEGNLTAIVSVTDLAGNTATDSKNFIKDIVPPAIAWGTPLANVC